MTVEYTTQPEEPHQEISQEQPNCEQPGQLLKEAREKQGISVEQAAKDLNFLPTYIPALENENFKPLHNPTFIKGYLRAYARYLKIDADKVLYCFGQHYPELAVQEKPLPVKSMPPERGKVGFIFKLLSLIIVLGLLAVAVLWWQSSNDDLPVRNATSVKVETLNGTVEATDLANQLPLTEEEQSLEVEDEAKTTREQQEEVDAVVVSEEAQPAAVVTAKEEPKKAAKEDTSALVANKKNKLFTGDLYASAVNPNQLGLSFTDDCWVEVRDASQNLVYADLMQANEELLLEGKAPFRIIFGNGTVAKLVYLGEDFNFSQRIRPNGYASVEVGAN